MGRGGGYFGDGPRTYPHSMVHLRRPGRDVKAVLNRFVEMVWLVDVGSRSGAGVVVE